MSDRLYARKLIKIWWRRRQPPNPLTAIPAVSRAAAPALSELLARAPDSMRGSIHTAWPDAPSSFLRWRSTRSSFLWVFAYFSADEPPRTAFLARQACADLYAE